MRVVKRYGASRDLLQDAPQSPDPDCADGDRSNFLESLRKAFGVEHFDDDRR